MQIKLNGWQRIGIVLSVIWFVGFGIYFWQNPVLIVDDPYVMQFIQCEQNYLDEFDAAKNEGDITAEKGIIGDPMKAEEDKWRAVAKLHKCNTQLFVAADFGTVILGWLVAWFSIAITKWVRRGFA